MLKAEPMAVWLRIDGAEFEPLQVLQQEIVIQRQRRRDVSLRGECHEPDAVVRTLFNEPFKTLFAMSNRFTRPPRTSKSSDSMLPDRSMATTMSTPLALILVSLW